jgi:predicted dinucleotide-binding enzyme
MEIAVIGTGFIGGILGRALARSGHAVTFGSRHPDDDEAAGETAATVTDIGSALRAANIVVLAVPGAAAEELGATFGGLLDGKLVVDATNRMGAAEANSRSLLPSGIRYARAFNTLGGENMENPVFPEGRADMFFSSPEPDRHAVETVIEGVGLRPVYVGADQEALVDCLFRLWVDLAMTQGRGRRLALRLLEG